MQKLSRKFFFPPRYFPTQHTFLEQTNNPGQPLPKDFSHSNSLNQVWQTGHLPVE